MLETDACVAGEQTKLVFVFTPLEPASSSASTLWEPAPSRRNVNQTQPICTLLIWNERESLNGILIMPTENFWPESFHRTCSLFGYLFSRSVVRFSRLLDFIELKFDFRLRSASSIVRIQLRIFLQEEILMMC